MLHYQLQRRFLLGHGARLRPTERRNHGARQLRHALLLHSTRTALLDHADGL